MKRMCTSALSKQPNLRALQHHLAVPVGERPAPRRLVALQDATVQLRIPEPKGQVKHVGRVV
jgi:hypothetical protein